MRRCGGRRDDNFDSPQMTSEHPALPCRLKFTYAAGGRGRAGDSVHDRPRSGSDRKTVWRSRSELLRGTGLARTCAGTCSAKAKPVEYVAVNGITARHGSIKPHACVGFFARPLPAKATSRASPRPLESAPRLKRYTDLRGRGFAWGERRRRARGGGKGEGAEKAHAGMGLYSTSN